MTLWVVLGGLVGLLAIVAALLWWGACILAGRLDESVRDILNVDDDY